jgi:putative transposase
MPCYNPKIHHRRSIRMRGYDYSLEGRYFVTITTFNRIHLFGEVVNGEIRLNAYGNIAHEQWIRLRKRFLPSDFEPFVIMPNHIHGIIHIVRGAGEKFEHDSTGNPPQRPYEDLHVTPGSLGAIVRAYKVSVTYRINAIRGYTNPPVWQRNYYEHIIRNEMEYKQIKDYIEANPAAWVEDRFYGPTIIE